MWKTFQGWGCTVGQMSEKVLWELALFYLCLLPLVVESGQTWDSQKKDLHKFWKIFSIDVFCRILDLFFVHVPLLLSQHMLKLNKNMMNWIYCVEIIHERQ